MAHKCSSPECQNQTDAIWCEKCLGELGELIEQNSIGYLPKRMSTER